MGLMKIPRFKGLAFKISSVIILTEVIILGFLNLMYAERFSRQIDRRIEERVELVGTLVENSLVRLISLHDEESMRLLIGEEVVDVLIVDVNRSKVVYALDISQYGVAIENVPGITLSWFDTQNPHKVLQRTKESGDNYLLSVTPLSDPLTGSLLYFLYIKSSTNEAEAEKDSLNRLLLLGSGGTILTTFLVIFFALRLMVLTKITDVLRVLQAIERGNLSVRVTDISAGDEIGTLQSGVNSMAAKREEAQNELTQLNEQLETRVMLRTRELETATNVSKQITTVLDIDQLLQQVVTLTTQSFELYGSFIFRCDDEKKLLFMKAGAYETGAAVDKNNFVAVAMNAVPSVVALAARTRQAVVINEAPQSDSFIPNPLMPETRSELALPMCLGDQLLGIYDLQSRQANRFGPDEQRVLQSLAEQVAVAMRNAELFTQVSMAREQAEQANNIKSQFLAAMSHELRTPLNAILNFSQFIATGMVGTVSAEQTDLLNKITDSGRHLLNLISDVLDISKIESGALRLFVEDNIDLEKEFFAAVAAAEGLLAHKPVELITELDSDMPHIMGDRRRIRQIMLNLVSNACKFTETGSITIRLTRHDHGILFIVKDTGPGIAPEDQSLVFETFRQTEAGLRQIEGTGLGLPISKRLAEAHGGRLWLESTPGNGATFYVNLPIYSEELSRMIKPTAQNRR
jgi:signal transduction histidine kinase/HAMP domain-containing protein